jgi:hypothetical protein
MFVCSGLAVFTVQWSSLRPCPASLVEVSTPSFGAMVLWIFDALQRTYSRRPWEYYVGILVVRIQDARPWMGLERLPVYEVLFVVCLFCGKVEARGPMHGLSPAQAQRKVHSHIW